MVREWIGRLGLLVLGLVLGLAVLELCLDLAAVVVAKINPVPTTAHWTGRGPKVVTLGDSNTFGLYVGRENAYPRAIEASWNAVPDGIPIEVVNLGYPGNNTSVLRRHLPDVLATYRPDVVTLMIGANDVWTTRETVGLREQLWRLSRVFRLLVMLERSRDVAGEHMPGVEGDSRWAPTPNNVWVDWQVQLRVNLEAMLAMIAPTGARPVLLTYPSSAPIYGETNAVLREVAAASGVALIDVTPTFDASCPKHTCPLLMPDQHPTSAGHHFAGHLIAVQLRRLLKNGRS